MTAQRPDNILNTLYNLSRIEEMRNIQHRPTISSKYFQQHASTPVKSTYRDVVSPVSIEDVDFLQQLSAGTVRLHTDDVLQVRLRTVQRIDRNNDIYTHHYIEKVLDYRKAEHLRQSDMFNDVDIKGGEEVS